MITWSGMLRTTTQHCFGNCLKRVSLKENLLGNKTCWWILYMCISSRLSFLHVWHSCGRACYIEKRGEWCGWGQLWLRAKIRRCHGFMSKVNMLSDISLSTSLGASKKSSDESMMKDWPSVALRGEERVKGLKKDEPWEIIWQTGRIRNL